MLKVNEKHGPGLRACSGNFASVTALHGHLHESSTASGRVKATWKSNVVWTAVAGQVHYGNVDGPRFQAYNKE